MAADIWLGGGQDAHVPEFSSSALVPDPASHLRPSWEEAMIAQLTESLPAMRRAGLG